jgi:hypothetical protein
MSQQSPQKVLDRILNYPNKEKGCVWLIERMDNK